MGLCAICRKPTLKIPARDVAEAASRLCGACQETLVRMIGRLSRTRAA